MDAMTNALEAIASLPEEYKLKISKHCVAGSSDSLEKALKAALNCSQTLNSLDRPKADQQQVSKTLLTIRKGLAAELLRLEGFDLEAAKSRGQAETTRTEEGSKKKWSNTVTPTTEHA